MIKVVKLFSSDQNVSLHLYPNILDLYPFSCFPICLVSVNESEISYVKRLSLTGICKYAKIKKKIFQAVKQL